MASSPVSILLTAYKEADTISRTLDALITQLPPGSEIYVICPDDETAQAASPYQAVTILRDPAKGKPAALNLGLRHAHHSIIVMTDGDVWIAPGALALLIAPFQGDPHIGAVTGRPISVNPRDTMLGYWSHLLTDAGAHEERARRDQHEEFMVCSGYLYAIRAGIITEIPEDALAEDGVVSHIIGERGYRIRYSPKAKVFVSYPSTYQDWLLQKVRSTGGYSHPVIINSRLKMRGFWQEATAGLIRAFAYPRNIREFLWTVLLMLARLHLWLLILWQVRIHRRPLSQLWQRVESTKHS